MPQADLEGNVYTPSGVVASTSPAAPDPVWTPPDPVAYDPVAPTYATSTTSTSSYTPAPLKDVMQDAIVNDSTYKQSMEWLDKQLEKDKARAAQEAIWWEKDYQLAMQQAQSSGGGGYSGEREAAALDQLQREQAAHQLELAKEAAREGLGVRTGQQAFEQGELQYQYENILKEINLRAQARRAAAAAAASAGNKARANAIANLQLQKEKHDVQVQWQLEDLQDTYVNDKGQLVLKTGERLMQAWWNPDTREYEGPGGERWDSRLNPIGGGSSTVYTPTAAYNTAIAKGNDMMGF